MRGYLSRYFDYLLRFMKPVLVLLCLTQGALGMWLGVSEVMEAQINGKALILLTLGLCGVIPLVMCFRGLVESKSRPLPRRPVR